MKTKQVIFEGQPLVLIRFSDGEGALVFPHQINEAENYIRFECLFELGFAEIDSDGQVWRLGSNTDDANYHPDLAEAWRALA